MHVQLMLSPTVCRTRNCEREWLDQNWFFFFFPTTHTWQEKCWVEKTIRAQLHVKNKQRMEWDNVCGLLCRPSSPRQPCIVYFSVHRGPEGGGNYLVARQRAAIIAPCTARMAAVNMDAGVRAAVGGQVLMLIKWERVPLCDFVSFPEPSVCTSSKCQRGSIPVCVSLHISTSIQLCMHMS